MAIPGGEDRLRHVMDDQKAGQMARQTAIQARHRAMQVLHLLQGIMMAHYHLQMVIKFINLAG